MRTQFVLQVDVIKRLKAVLNVLLLTIDLHAASDHWSLATTDASLSTLYQLNSLKTIKWTADAYNMCWQIKLNFEVLTCNS